MGGASGGFGGLSRLVLLGAPGSGKGTQAAILSERLGVPAISTGDMLRASVASGSELGKRVEAIMAAGALVDDETMGEIVRERLSSPDCGTGFILDGYPRTGVQVEALDRILADLGIGLDAALQIDVDRETLVERMLGRGRGADDTEEVIRHRLEVYEDKTAPLVASYRDRGVLRRVDGNGTIAAVTAELMTALEEAA